VIQSPASDAARRIRQYILHHGLRPGDQLPTHEELSKCLKVGRCRLREGLSILRHQGILETHNKGGTVVCQSSVKPLNEPISWHLDSTGYDLENVVAARAWLESGAAAEAARRRTARDLLKILDVLERLEALIEAERNDWPEDEAFHLAIMEATHNPVIVTFGQLVRLNFRSQDTQEPPSAMWRRECSRQHRVIYDAIERQEAEDARTLMFAHVMGRQNQLNATFHNGSCGRNNQRRRDSALV
jgi:GntR family transcriptional regulator, transcriptional repressor for pyruvate dehydrogenase complex